MLRLLNSRHLPWVASCGLGDESGEPVSSSFLLLSSLPLSSLPLSSPPPPPSSMLFSLSRYLRMLAKKSSKPRGSSSDFAPAVRLATSAGGLPAVGRASTAVLASATVARMAEWRMMSCVA